VEHKQQWYDIADDGRLNSQQAQELFNSIGKTGIEARKLFRDATASPDGKVAFQQFVKWDQKERLGADPTKTAASAFKAAESMFAGFAKKRTTCNENIAIDRKSIALIDDTMELPTYRRNMIAESLKEKQAEYAALEDMYDKLLAQQVNMKNMLKGGFPKANHTAQLDMCAHTGRPPSKKPVPPPPVTLPRLVQPKDCTTRKCPRTARFRGNLETTKEVRKQTFSALASSRSSQSGPSTNKSGSPSRPTNKSGSQTARF